MAVDARLNARHVVLRAILNARLEVDVVLACTACLNLGGAGGLRALVLGALGAVVDVAAVRAVRRGVRCVVTLWFATSWT